MVLPLVAILLLGMMFMMTKNVPELTEIPFASGALKERSKSEQVAEPNYMGMTKEGDVLNVFAETLNLRIKRCPICWQCGQSQKSRPRRAV